MNHLTSVSIVLVILASIYHVSGGQINIDIDNDLSRPTFGSIQPTSSSFSWDDRTGFNVKGHVNDVLAQPLKTANGSQNYTGISQTTNDNHQAPLRPGLVGVDTNLLEMIGLPHLIKGGLLMGKAATKVGGATLLGGIKGKKIASIIELPVKLIALKELAIGSALTGMGRMKNQQGQSNYYPEQHIQQEQIKQESSTGGQAKNPLGSLSDKLMATSQNLKQYGKQQMIQGTTDSINMFANHLQQTANNAAAGLKLLPLILDLPSGSNLHSNMNNNNNNNPLINGVKGTSNVQGPSSSFSGSPVLQGLNTLLSPIGPVKSGIFDPNTSLNPYQTGGSNVKGGSQGFTNLHQNLGQTFNGLTGLIGPAGLGGLLGLGNSNLNHSNHSNTVYSI